MLALTAIMALPMALLIGSVGWNDLRDRRSFLATRPLVWLGEISYEIFLLHVITMEVAMAGNGSWSSASSPSAD